MLSILSLTAYSQDDTAPLEANIEQAEPAEQVKPVEQAEPAEQAEPEQGSKWVPSHKLAHIFQTYKIQLEFVRPSFPEEDFAAYDDFYGKENLQFNVRVDYTPFRWNYFAAGLLFRGGYYTDKGYASKTPIADAYLKDPESKLNLTIIPMQVGGAIRLSPFSYKWLVLEGWGGLERSFFQESRVASAESTPAAADSAPTPGTYVNSYWTSQLFVGAAVNFLLNPLDETSVRSGGVLGITRIFLAPFMEVYRSLGNAGSPVKLDRNVYGIGFGFETRGID